jgi:PadR family transcriptional regulator AphA
LSTRGHLTPFSFVILALVGRGGASAHDLVVMMRRGRVYWAAAESHYYAEPKRLQRLGYLQSELRPGRTTERRVYTLSELGVQALSDWLRAPTGLPRTQNEAIVKLMAGDLCDDRELAASLGAMRGELDALETQLRANLEIAASVPHRARYLRLVHDFGLRTVAMQREWLDEVERELDGSDSA